MSGDKCEHAWDDEYVCRACGCVKTGSPPWWLWVHKGLPGGPRAVLMALWTCADRNTTTPRPVYPRNKTISERSNGLAHSTIRSHLNTLKALGWIALVDHPGRVFRLAWARPFPAGKQALPLESQRAGKQADPAGKQADPRQDNSVQPLESQRHTYELPGVVTEELPGEAPATPHEETRHERDTRSNHDHIHPHPTRVLTGQDGRAADAHGHRAPARDRGGEPAEGGDRSGGEGVGLPGSDGREPVRRGALAAGVDDDGERDRGTSTATPQARARHGDLTHADSTDSAPGQSAAKAPTAGAAGVGHRAPATLDSDARSRGANPQLAASLVAHANRTVPAPSPHSAVSGAGRASQLQLGTRAPTAPGCASGPKSDGDGGPTAGDGRADLSPEVEAAVRAGKMGGQLHGVTWRKCLLEALDDIGVAEGKQAEAVAEVLAHWHNSRPGDKPAKSQVWYRRWRDWQRAAMGLGDGRKSKASGMSSGLTSSRPRPTWDEPDEERRAAQ